MNKNDFSQNFGGVIKNKLLWYYWYYDSFEIFMPRYPNGYKVLIYMKNINEKEEFNKLLSDISFTSIILEICGGTEHEYEQKRF